MGVLRMKEVINIHPVQCYGFKEPKFYFQKEDLSEWVKHGKIVGEWKEEFKIYTDFSKNRSRMDLFLEYNPSSLNEFKIDSVTNLWQCLEIFSAGNLDVLILGDKVLFFTDQQIEMLEEFTSWSHKIENSIKKNDLSSIEIPEFEESCSNDPYLLNQYGKLLVMAQDYSKAGRVFRLAIEQEYNFSEPYSNLGALMWQLGSQKEAFELFTEAILKNPNHSISQLNFFDAAYELEDYKTIVKVIDHCLVHSVHPTELLLHKAIASNKIGNNNEAKDILENILLANPDDKEAKELLEKIAANQ